MGGLDRAVDLAKELANIPKDKGVQRVVLPYPRTFLQGLMDGNLELRSQTRQRQEALALLPEDAQRAFRYMAMLERMKNGEAMYLMPFELRIK